MQTLDHKQNFKEYQLTSTINLAYIYVQRLVGNMYGFSSEGEIPFILCTNGLFRYAHGVHRITFLQFLAKNLPFDKNFQNVNTAKNVNYICGL